ncbi:MAG: hypothetical protein ACYTKD_30470, partial [Planctomycetota bacterium]
MTRGRSLRRVNMPGRAFSHARLAALSTALSAALALALPASARAQGGPRGDDDAPPVTDVPAAGEPLTVYDAPPVGDPAGDAEVGEVG